MGTLSGGWALSGIFGGVWAPLGWGPVGYFCESAIIGYLKLKKDFVVFWFLAPSPIYHNPNVWGIFNLCALTCYSNLICPVPPRLTRTTPKPAEGRSPTFLDCGPLKQTKQVHALMRNGHMCIYIYIYILEF